MAAEAHPVLRSLRWATVLLLSFNFAVAAMGGVLLSIVLRSCGRREKAPVFMVAAAAGFKIVSKIGAGMAQRVTAISVLRHPFGGGPFEVESADARQLIKMRYKRWLWWTRFGMGVTILQFVGALYLLYDTVKNFSYDGKSRECFLGWDVESRGRKQISVIVFVILAWIVVIIQCFTGSDVLRWRSFYATHDTAWKAHYLEVFDHGIREALCCLGRVKYLSVLEEDEVYSVARLLGDLVAYRASGTGHLEFLAGLALLQRHRESPDFCGELIEAPESRIREAASFHPFAEAAYTGPLLDFGRNPVLFPCAWVYRQGILTPWTRNRRPVLEGDNWWRGHAAAFLKYVNLPPDALRKGRVSQTKREAAYFIVVLHQLKAVVIAVRGTETPEDLLTDGLCRECPLTEDDLDGLINSGHLDPGVRERVLSTFPHYGHSGIVESARELFMQIDGLPNDNDGSHSGTTGFLSSLVGAGQECYGYRVCVVGHSLGGSVATLLGIRLYRRYPNLHVYSFGTLPCVDSVVAEACSDFVTSIVYNDEFSARLSVNSIIRLRAAAITALSNDSSADSAMICKLARRILHANKHPESDGNHEGISPSLDSTTLNLENSNHVHKRNCTYSVKGGAFLCAHAVSCMVNMPTKNPCSPPSKDGCDFSSGIMLEGNDISDTKGSKLAAGSGGPVQEFHSQEGCSLTENLNFDIRRNGCNDFNYRDALVDNVYDTRSSGMKCFEGSEDLLSFEDHTSRFMESMSMSVEISTGDPPEMYLPGLIIHIIPEQRSLLPLWKNWRFHDRKYGYRAFVARRENFKDIIVTPYMFLDHLPWRCHYAMQRVLETWKADGQLATHDLLNGEHAV